MDRPVLNPPLFSDEPTDGLEAGPRGTSAMWRAAIALWRAARRTGRLLIRLLRTRFTMRRGVAPGDVDALEDRRTRPFWRWVRWILLRLTIVPPAVAACVILLVHAATHPSLVRPSGALAEMAASSLSGLYGEMVWITAADGVRSGGWLVPALEPRDVVQMRETALRTRSAAVVLVHDQESGGEQLLPLVRPLHDAGFVVLMLDLRGGGTAEPAARTFGLNEARDVSAAVRMLRGRSFVDGRRIAVVGVGTGASAALLAARDDSDLRTLVLDGLPAGAAEATGRMVPPRQWLQWLAPACTWTFELSCGVDADQLELDRLAPVMETRQVLHLPDRAGARFDSATMKQIAGFLSMHLAPRRPASVAQSPQ